MANNKFETLKEPFNTNGLNYNVWNSFTAGSATLTGNRRGFGTNYPASSTSSTDGDISSKSLFDLTSSYASLEVVSVPNASATAADATFQLKLDLNNYLNWQIEAGSIYAEYAVAGSQTNGFNESYDAIKHRFWRIRERGGTTYWETSNNGINWVTKYSIANPIAVTALTLVISGTCYAATSNPGRFEYRNLNTIQRNQLPVMVKAARLAGRPAAGGGPTRNSNFFVFFK